MLISLAMISSRILYVVAVVVVGGLVVQGDQVRSEVPLEVAPYRMDMVGVVLRAVVLYKKRRALDAIVVPLPLLKPAHPCELHRIHARLSDCVQPLLGDIRRLHIGVLLYERQAESLLLFVESTVGDAPVLEDGG